MRGVQEKAPDPVGGLFLYEIEREKLLLRRIVEFGSFVPVDNVPPSLDVITAQVLILQVVRMLPDVQPKDGLAASREQIGSVLIRCGVDGQFPISDDQPCPARTEAAQTRGSKFFLKSSERPKRRADSSRKVSLGLPATALLHQRTEEGVGHA